MDTKKNNTKSASQENTQKLPLALSEQEQQDLVKDSSMVTNTVETQEKLSDILTSQSKIFARLHSQKHIAQVLQSLEEDVVFSSLPTFYRKNLYYVTIELLQNAFKHTSEYDQERGTKGQEYTQNNCDFVPRAYIRMNQKENTLEVFTENYIFENQVDSLKNKIDHVNNETAENLKSEYKDTMVNHEFSDRGTAGLGFLDMSRKVKSKLNKLGQDGDNFASFDYSFEDTDKEGKKMCKIVFRLPLPIEGKDNIQSLSSQKTSAS